MASTVQALSSTISSKLLSWGTVVRAVVFCLLFLAMDRALGGFLDHQYRRIFTGPGRYNYFTTHRFEGLVMGSSTSTAYYDDELSHCLSRPVLNVGIDGAALAYSVSLLKLLLRDHVPPDFIVLNVDLFELLPGSWDGNFYSMIEQFRPLYGRVPEIDAALARGRPFEALKYLLHTYRYNDLLLSLAQKRLEGRSEYSRGRSPSSVMTLPVDFQTVREKFGSEYAVDERKVELYGAFAKLSRDNGIVLLMVESPVFYPQGDMTARDRRLEGIMRDVAARENVPFIAITQDTHPVFRDHTLFKDVLHLNDRGSSIFTGIICDELARRGFVDSGAGRASPSAGS